MIRNIVFDMGNVLFDFNSRQYVEPYAKDEQELRLLQTGIFGAVEWVQYDRGTLTGEQALEGICANMPEQLHPAVRDIFLHWHESLKPLDAMVELAHNLKQQGYGVYLLSNAAQNFYTFRKHLPVLEEFDGIFISSDWKLLKPDPAIFRAFCAHFSLVPSQCFFIDDAPQNVEGAMRAGMPGVVFHGDVQRLCKQLPVGGG